MIFDNHFGDGVVVYGESNLNDDEGLELWGLEWAAARERERDDANINKMR